ncbi:MAG: hypothetical protein HPY45_07685 [Anaerolineae bacterium]|nr:hypothetical protein [Anaerolineae bacterium]
MIQAVSSIYAGWAYAAQVYAAGENQSARRQTGQGKEQAQPSGSPQPAAAQPASGQQSKDPLTGLDKQQQAEVETLKKRDREVRAHEQAHLAAGGNLVRGGAVFEYKTGPDGKRYAVGGEVSIDTSEVPDDPQATLRKAAQIKRAALAPAQPSAQDYRVAAQASQMEARAAMQLMRQNYASAFGGKEAAAISTTSFGV